MRTTEQYSGEEGGNIIIMRAFEFMGETSEEVVKCTDMESDDFDKPFMFKTKENAENFISLLKEDEEEHADYYIILEMLGQVEG